MFKIQTQLAVWEAAVSKNPQLALFFQPRRLSLVKDKEKQTFH